LGLNYRFPADVHEETAWTATPGPTPASPRSALGPSGHPFGAGLHAARLGCVLPMGGTSPPTDPAWAARQRPPLGALPAFPRSVLRY